MRRRSARPIPIDKSKVSALARRILVMLPKHLKFRSDPNDSLYFQRGFTNEWGFWAGRFSGSGQYVTDDVRGEPVRVNVKVSAQRANLTRSSARYYIVQGYVRHYNHSGVKHQMGVVFDAARTVNELLQNTREIYRELYSVLIHEVTHLRDLLSRDGTLKVLEDKGQQDYYNDPTEVRAFMQQIADEVIGALGSTYRTNKTLDRIKPLSEARALTRSDFLRVLDRKSNTWRRVRLLLSERSKKTLLKGVFRAVQDEWGLSQ